MKQVSDIERIAASGTMLTLLLICMLPLAFNIQPTTCEEFAPLHFDLKIWPEHPTVHDQVNVTVMFSDVPSISYGFVFDSLIQVDNGFSVNINVSIPLVILYVYAGNVTHTYELGKLSEGSYNFSATVHYRLQQLDGSWQLWPFDGSYSEAFAVSPSAVFNVASTKTVIGVGFCDNITVYITNNFDCPQTFNVTAYATPQANTTSIGTQQVNNLSAASQTALLFLWNTTGFSYGNYTISAYASPVPAETDTPGKGYGGILTVVTIPGDLNNDFKVSLADLFILAQHYGHRPPDGHIEGISEYETCFNADIDGNGAVGLSDLVILAQHYGQHYA